MGTAGILEEPGGLRAFFDDSAIHTLNFPPGALRHESPFEPAHPPPLDCDPIFIGERFFVAPSWVNDPTPPGRFRLTIDATSAFGSGRHESTQMCIEALEQHLLPGQVVLDIGCGSGILAAAAHLLGAAMVVSCDIHHESVRSAQTLIGAPFFVGSADSIKPHAGDLVLANISVKVLDLIAQDLQRIAKPDGLIVLGGFIHENTPQNFRPHKILKKGDWQCWLCRPQDITPPESPPDFTSHSQQWWL